MSFCMRTLRALLSSLFKFCLVLSVCLLIYAEDKADAEYHFEKRIEAYGQLKMYYNFTLKKFLTE